MHTNHEESEVLRSERITEPPPSGIRAQARERPPVRAYAELEGGHGREVYFRPQRYPRQDLGPVLPVVRIVFGRSDGSQNSSARSKTRECALHDVSQNGVALEWPADTAIEAIEIGAVLPELALSFDGHEAYRGEARVGSVREFNGKTIVGLSLLDSLMNIDDVLVLRDVKAWVSSGANGLGLASPAWRVEGHDRFKALVAELGLFLEDAKRELSRLEDSLPWHVIHGEQPSPARDALIERVRSEFVVEFIRYAEEIDRASRTALDADLDPLKEYSRRKIQALLLESPCLHRAFHKPLGYPGDYEVMRYMYEQHFVGPTLFAKSLNLAICETRGVAAVRARKDLVKERLSRLLDAASPDKPLRILAIASGPAQEIYELLNEREHIEPRRVEIVLFDQDKRALSFAYSRLERAVDSRWAERVRVVYLHDSIKRLLRDAHIFDGLGAFDIVFSCGLFDYLQLRTAIALCGSLVRSVAPGGSLYVGNMVPTNPNRWIMDLHLDWPLVYRTRSAMTDFARLASPEPTVAVEVVEERTALNPFVCLTRT